MVLSTIASIFSSINQPISSSYLPFSIFGILHATRIACAYRGVTRAGGYDSRIGLFQAGLVPIILVLGGTTITSILLGSTPGWVYTPIPLINYGLFPVLAAKSGLVTFLLSLPPLPRELFFSLVDGFSRTGGITSMGLDAVLNHSNAALKNNPWTMICIATLAGGGGGMIVPAFRGFHADFAFGTPPWVATYPGIDIWGATVVGYVYATLIDAHPFFRILPSLFFPLHFLLPKSYLSSTTPSPLLSGPEAKIACSLLLGAMLMVRVLNPMIQATLKGPKGKKVKAIAAQPSLAVPAKSLRKRASKSDLKEKKAQ